MNTARYRLHGLKLSYFTGKIEAYFRAKGIAHDFVEMDTADFRACAKATGIAQMPQVECPDGMWLTDTTEIIKHFEALDSEPRLTPETDILQFLSRLLEDLFDEWLWRPALYYRWAFKQDARLMSHQIAATMLRDMNLPLELRRRFILARQRRVYLKQDGITPKTSSQVENLFHRTLAALEPIFAERKYLLGARPCEADFGLFASMFRHFSSDPTPAGIMRESAPHTLAWVARLWATPPDVHRQAVPITELPDDLEPFWAMTALEYLPYLQANATAVSAGQQEVRYEQEGVAWRLPVSPYRARCLNQLQIQYRALSETDQATADQLHAGLHPILSATSDEVKQPPTGKPVGRDWR